MKRIGSSNKSLEERKQNFLDFVTTKYQNKYDYSKAEYLGVNIKIRIVCPKHGEFWQKPPCAVGSSISEKEWLDYLNVPDDARNIVLNVDGRQIKTDAFDINTNTIYEFYGDLWHGNLNVFNEGEKHPYLNGTYKDVNKKTFDREKYLKDRGYKIISVWKSDWKIIKKGLKK